MGFTPAPDFAESGTVYTMTTERPTDDDGPGSVATVQVLTRWQAELESLTVDPFSAEVLMRVPRPRPDHIGGEIAFDDRGLLYTSFGAKEGSPEAQDPSTFDARSCGSTPRRPKGTGRTAYRTTTRSSQAAGCLRCTPTATGTLRLP